MWYRTVFFVFSANFIINIDAAHLPKEFKTCKQSEPKYEDCMKSALEGAFKQLKAGNRELGINPLEPLELPEMRAPGSGSTVKIDQRYIDLKMFGLSDTKIEGFKLDLDKCIIEVDAVTPFVRIESDYDFKGQLILIPINSKGKSNNTLFNLKTHSRLTCEKFQKKNKNYIKINEFKLSMDPDRVSFNYDSVFDADKSIADEIGKVLNENSKVIFDDSKSDWEYSYGLVFKEFANRIFTRVPVDEIFFE